ncbi:MAG: YicC/YloC family endoribonuclease, partial [Bacteroidales bacterium]
MLQSMTGYGKAEVNLADKKVTIEIKSLNSKNIDTNVKIPVFYREKEMQIRKLLQEELKRGKIDFNIFYELNEGVTPSSINEGVVKAYYNQISALKEYINLDSADVLSAILRLPDSVRTDKLEADESEWKEVEEKI